MEDLETAPRSLDAARRRSGTAEASEAGLPPSDLHFRRVPLAAT